MSTVSAIDDPKLASAIAANALAEDSAPVEVQVKLPSDTTVALPGGYVRSDGSVARSAEVRELTGRDEELISKASTVGKALITVLNRGVVSVGDEPASDALLDELLAGDREALLIGIYIATFGNPAEINGWCKGCEKLKEISVDLRTDIKSKALIDTEHDKLFTVQGRKHDYTVGLPTGHTQKDLNDNADKTGAELATILLYSTVKQIDGNAIFSKQQIQNMSVVDRRKVSEEIAKRNPGPVFEDITVECDVCGSEVVAPINIGGLFQF